MVKNYFQRRLVSYLLLFAFSLSLAGVPLSPARAQEPAPTSPATPQPDKVELHQALVDLTNTWTVMCVAAHPDDEDGTTLTVLRRRDGAHTVSLFSTYGEGGQNAVGPQLYEELGVIRAQETMRAAKIQGSEPYFLGLKDFGFSKSADEAFKVWGHDEALRRMVLKIRELRPDVIITHHDTTSGHGHHQATGRLIIEAFDAAADPKRFPEQLDQVKPWQAQRLFVRVFGANAQKPAGESERVFAVDPNEVDPVRGTSFAEQALAALQQHATQGPWPKSITELMRARRIEAGKLPLIRYRLLREAAGVPPLPQDAGTPWAGLELPATLIPDITPPKIEGRPLSSFIDRPDRVAAVLIGWRASRGLRALVTGDLERFRLFESRVDRALAVATGISLTLASRDTVLVPGVQSTFSFDLTNLSMRAVHVDALQFNGGGEPVRLDIADVLLPGTETNVTVDSTTPKNATLTVPQAEHLYDGLFLGKHLEATALVDFDGAKFPLHAELSLPVVPAVEIKSISPSPCVRTEETLGWCDAFKVMLLNHLATPFRGTMEIGAANGGHTRSASYQLVLGPNEQRDDLLSVRDPKAGRETLNERRSSGSVELSIKTLDSTDLITKRTVPVVYSAARVARNLRVGYVPSFDQTLEHSLAALGVSSKALTVDEIKSADLSIYNTIIIDNRGYEAHPELIAANSRLLDFVKAGGTLIVFYHKDNEWNPDEKKNRPQLAPYPIILDDKRVTDETAPITFIRRHPLLNSPNRITPADFSNWIQERGLYYPKQWDGHYTEIFSSNDPGEPPLTGGLLVTQHGKGKYIYTSMVWYRELRAGVPGAYRMFANMISYGHR